MSNISSWYTPPTTSKCVSIKNTRSEEEPVAVPSLNLASYPQTKLVDRKERLRRSSRTPRTTPSSCQLHPLVTAIIVISAIGPMRDPTRAIPTATRRGRSRAAPCTSSPWSGSPTPGSTSQTQSHSSTYSGGRSVGSTWPGMTTLRRASLMSWWPSPGWLGIFRRAVRGQRGCM